MIIPIPKSARKSLSDLSNYRGIALNSPLSKLFELVILDAHRDVLNTTDLQFGFKSKSSTTQCTFVVQETIQYYLDRQTPVYCMLLDASQAFDGLEYVKLFRELYKRGMCSLVCRILLRMHIFQQVRVRWGKAVSDAISVSNGVKQGGIISPVLFTIYADIILSELKHSQQGCHIGNTYVGAFGYADDIILISPTRSGMISMLNTAKCCGDTLKLKFNPSKCQFLIFSPHERVVDDRPIQFCGINVELSSSAIHLGHYIGSKQRTEAVRNSVDDLYRRTNSLMSKFSFCTFDCRYRLFRTYCMSAYGSCLWDFDNPAVENFFCAWRKCVRKVLRLPARTHCNLLPVIVGDVPVEIQIHRRFANFMNACKTSQNSIVKLCAEIAVRGSCSPASNSLSKICELYKFHRESLPLKISNDTSSWNGTLKPRAGAIRDFLSFRDSTSDDSEEVIEILIHLCTS